MSSAGHRGRRWRLAIVCCVVTTAGLAVSACGSAKTASPLACPTAPRTTPSAASGASAAPAGQGGSAATSHWSLPGGNLANTRDVDGGINSSNVSQLGVAWTVPLTIPVAHTDGAYATNPVVVRGVVYVQDLESDVMAISLATGKVLWEHRYDLPNGGPDGVTVGGGVVYGATNRAAFALSAATGSQLWTRTLIRNGHEGIDMAPGFHDDTVYVSTVPSNTTGQYRPDAKGVLWALDAATGAPRWSWDEVQNLWGKPGINSGGGQWYPPSFDANGDIYLGVANPGPVAGVPGYPWGTSRPGPDLYTDSIVKLSPAGKLLWYYQLTPHDLYDWDLQNSPVLSTVAGRPVVIDGGKAGILVELDAQTGKPIWKRPVGLHNGHDNDGLLTEHATSASRVKLPNDFCLEPGVYGGILTQLASNGSTTFAAINDLPTPVCATGGGCPIDTKAATNAVFKATGEVVAVAQSGGQVEWDTRLPSSPYGGATVTNDVVFTTTFDGDLYALDASNGAILRTIPLSAGSNAPVTVDGDYVIAGAGIALSKSQRPLIIAYKLGATGTLPDTVTG
jgi:outer membrane protein assembly factor BamB